MRKAVLSNRIYLNKTDVLIESLEKNLTYKFATYDPKAPPEVSYDVTSVTDEVLSIPSGRLDLIPLEYEIIDKRVLNPIKFPETNIILRQDQQEIYDQVDDNCIINAKGGWGKTFTALAIAAKLSQKTLVIVHTVALRDQWAKEVKKVFNIEPGIIGSSKFNIDSPIVLANTQTLKNHILKLTKEFGTVLVDECHRLPANSFKNMVDKLKARYKIGLSGTLHRKDGKHVMIQNYLGTKVLIAKESNVVEPHVLILNTQIPLDAGRQIPWANSINKLMSLNSYNDLIVQITNSQVEAGYKVLVVADRTEFLERCSERVNRSVAITSNTEGREELLELAVDGTVSAVFGTLSIFKEGINVPRWDCLILATPIGHNAPMLSQLIWRITRPFEGKKQPMIIDIGLKGNTAYRQLQARLNLYIGDGYKIRYEDI